MPNVLSSYIEKKIVPNKFPTVPNDKIRLAIVGEAPGQDEELMGTPFVGASGRLLRGLLSNVGVAADQCFIGNVCQVRPPDNDISAFPWDSEPIQSGLQQLKNDLITFRPNCVLSLGRSPLRAFRPDLVRVDKKGAESVAIGDWRGSILPCTSDLLLPERNKIVVAYHPAYILRLYSDRPLLSFDIARAAKQARFPEINSTNRLIHTRPTCSEVLQYLANIRENHTKTAFDIEGWTDNVGVTMLSIARSPTDCMVIPFFLNGQHYWTLEEEILIWTSIAAWAADPDCSKTAQNAMYELFVLAWSHKLKLTGVDSDTMFKHWELFPEFEKSLALQTSIYTEEPYYKDDRESTNTETRLLYNGKDSCVTLESDNVVDQQLAKLPRSYDHYRFNISILPAINYLSLRGCCFSADAANRELVATQTKLDAIGAEVNQALGREFNAKSVPDKQWLLYTFFGYEPYKKYGKPNTSTNEETLLRYYSKHRNPLLKQIITLVSLRTRKSDIGKLSTDADGRIRSNFNLVGTNTARISSSSSSARLPYFTKSGLLKWDFSGTNLQNVTKDLRVCFTADTPEHAFFQCDLSGADGWTVAADLAALGHSTMLDDYLAGIKPAKVLLLMLDEYAAGRNPASINNLDRQTLRNLTRSLTFPDGHDEHGRPGDWKYICMKKVQHGTNYGMEPDKLSATIFKESEGTIDLTTREAGIYQYLYKLRYNPQARTDWVRRELRDKGYLQTASGFRRQFFGIRNRSQPDDDVVREALACEPQANTTYVCNLALQKLWYDPQNRTSKNLFHVEPLILIHDAIAGQFKRNFADSFAVPKLKTWFNNPIRIHGIDITIPFEGGYGTDWKNSHEVTF